MRITNIKQRKVFILKRTKKIEKIVERFMKIKTLETELSNEIYSWIESQGIDTYDDKFADAIAVRLGNNEFDSIEHFFDDLERFKKGELVGYG